MVYTRRKFAASPEHSKDIQNYGFVGTHYFCYLYTCTQKCLVTWQPISSCLSHGSVPEEMAVFHFLSSTWVLKKRSRI